MKYLRVLSALGLLVAAGCVESDSPTAPLLEQSVFAALGGLNVGETLSLEGADAADLLLGGPSVGADFVIIPFHASLVRGADVLVEVSGRSLANTTRSATRAPSTAEPALRINPREQSWEMHEALHEHLRRAIEPRLPGLQREIDRRQRAGLAMSHQLSGDNLEVGALVELNTAVFGDPCTEIDLRTGRIEAITDRAIIVGDIDNPDEGFTRADYESFGDEFDSLVDPTITGVFGNPPDIDENDRVVIFFTRAVNEMTEPGDEGFVGGFFYARDLFPHTGADPCAASNAAEMFYILVPDPNAEASPIDHSRESVFTGALGTIGHEYQHLINAGRRIWINNNDPQFWFEETWLNEGLSHIGEELLFYADAGIPPRSNVSTSHLQSDAVVAAINRFGVQNLIRYGLYLDDVTDDSAIEADDDLATRGAAWAFLRYLADHREEQTDAEFFRDLVNSRTSGFQNLGSVLREPPVRWLQRWGVSIYTDDLIPASADPLLQQPSWDFRDLLANPGLFGEFPLAVRTLSGTGAVQMDILSGTSGYIEFRGSSDQAARVGVSSGGDTPPDDLHVTVVRTQ